jgi:hypothetical protein
VEQAFAASHVSCNHFDEDGVLSAWCWMHKDECLRHEAGVTGLSFSGQALNSLSDWCMCHCNNILFHLLRDELRQAVTSAVEGIWYLEAA